MTAPDAPPPFPRSVAVIGAGTMGAGIGLAFAVAGAPVVMTARREATLERARRRLRASLRLLVAHGMVQPGEEGLVLDRIGMSAIFDEVDFGVDLVIESIVEDPQEKRKVLEAAERRATRGTVITTNTSSLSLAGLSSALERPDRFAGYHWFNPPELVQLVEVVPGPDTGKETTRRLVDWSTAIGKHPVLVRRELEGFVANRLQYALIREAYALVEERICSVEDVDRVVKAGLGPRWAAVGPFESMDLAGLDVHHEVVRRLFPSLSNRTAVPRMLRRLVSRGALGAKSGRGLCGQYDEAALERLAEGRASILLSLASLARAGGRKEGGRATIDAEAT